MLCVFTWVTDAHDKLEINLNYTFCWSKRPPTYPQIVVKSFIYSLTNQSHDSGVNLQEVIKINGSLLVCVAACNCSQTTGTHFDSLREREKKLRKRKPTAYMYLWTPRARMSGVDGCLQLIISVISDPYASAMFLASALVECNWRRLYMYNTCYTRLNHLPSNGVATDPMTVFFFCIYNAFKYWWSLFSLKYIVLKLQ